MVVFGVVGPLVGGFLWVGLLWLFAGVIVWLALALTVILLLVMTILCYVKAGLAPNLTSALGLDGADNNISICNAPPQSDDMPAAHPPHASRERERDQPPHRSSARVTHVSAPPPPPTPSPSNTRHRSTDDAAISTDTQEELFESLAPSENSDAYAALAVIMTILLVFVCVMLIMCTPPRRLRADSTQTRHNPRRAQK